MKTNQAIYLILLLLGLLIVTLGDQFIQKEFAWSIGFVLMMFSIYKISVSWRTERDKEEEN